MNTGGKVTRRLFGGNIYACLFLILCVGLSAGTEARTIPDVISTKSKALIVRPDQAPRTYDQLKEHLRTYRQDPNNQNLLMEIGRDYLALAAGDQFHHLDQAVTFFKKVKKAFPNDPVVLMFLGRAIGAKALDQSPSTMTRLRWAREGFRYMDQSIKLDDQSLHLRLLRAEAQMLAHPILRRGSRLQQDHAFISKYTKGLSFEGLSNFQKARVHLFLGNYHERKKKKTDAAKHWEEVIKLADNTAAADEAKARLKGSFRSLGYEE